MNQQVWPIVSNSKQGRLEIADDGLRISTAAETRTLPWDRIGAVEFGEKTSTTIRLTPRDGGAVSFDPSTGSASAGVFRPVDRVVEFGTAAELSAFRQALWRCGKLAVGRISVLPSTTNSDVTVAPKRGTVVKKPQPLTNAAIAAGVGAYAGIRAIAIGVAVLIIVLGLVYTHSGSFKEQCLMHKLGGESIGFVKNVVCDADFTIKD